MIETYVIMHGNKPVRVIIGRRQAVDALLEGGFKVNPSERRRITLFMEGLVPDAGTGITLVGFPPGVPDRGAIRVPGPGSEV